MIESLLCEPSEYSYSRTSCMIIEFRIEDRNLFKCGIFLLPITDNSQN